MNLRHPKAFKKLLVLLIFSISISISSVSFAQEEKGIFDYVSSFLKTSILGDSGQSRWNILFSSPRKNKSATQVKPSTSSATSSNQVKNLSDLLRSRRSGSSTRKSTPRPAVSVPTSSQTTQQTRTTRSSVGRTSISCTDSDGGRNEFQRGAVTLRMGSSTEKFSDKSIGNGILEYECKSRGVEGEFIDCENGSEYGACAESVTPECVVPSCAQPESGCHYGGGYFSNGCPNPCANLVCEINEDEVDLEYFKLISINSIPTSDVYSAMPGREFKIAWKSNADYCETFGDPAMASEYSGEVWGNLRLKSSGNKTLTYEHKNLGKYVDSMTLGLRCYKGSSSAKKEFTIWKKSENDPEIDLTPRISYWSGKVNQHTEDGVWKTDPDGRSGANLNKLTYCQKFYPGTTAYREYKNEKITDWRDAGNRNSYVSTKMTYECYGENVVAVSKLYATQVYMPDQEIVAGTDDVTFLEFALDNSSASEVNINALGFNAYGTGNAKAYQNFSAAVFVNGTQQGSSQNISGTNGYLHFSDLSVPISAHGQREFALVLNTIEASAPGSLKMGLALVESLDSNIEVFNGSNPVAFTHILYGPTFELTSGGKLAVSTGSTVYSDILVAGEDDREIMKIRFDAEGDQIDVKDLYLSNAIGIDFGARADFKLYGEGGRLIQTKQMTSGDKLHFELSNQDRIVVPKGFSILVTIKVDMRDITSEIQTGKRLQLKLDDIEAVSGSTGADLPSANYILQNVAGEEFVAYKSQISLKHSQRQPNFQEPSAAMQEVYRFDVTADRAGEIELGRVELSLNLAGIQSSRDKIVSTDMDVFLVNSNGILDTNGKVASIATQRDNTKTSVKPIINFQNQRLSAGETRTYALMIGGLENDSSMASDDDAVAVSFGSRTIKQFAVSRNSHAGYFIWSDMASSSHSEASRDWHSGYLLDIDTTAKVIAD